MTISEKVDQLINTNHHGIKSASGLEAFLGVAEGAITSPMRSGKAVNFQVSKKLYEKLNVNPDWWEHNIGPVYSSAGNVDVAPTPRETFYQHLIEDDGDYTLVPATVLRDSKIVPSVVLEMLYEERDELKNEVAALRKEIEALRRADIRS